MPKPKILQEGASYTFRGYSFTRERLQLPKTNRELNSLPQLQQQLEETIPYVTLSSEAAKREILIAPVLTRVAVTSRHLLRIEYPLKVSEQLQGNLDYFIQSEQGLIVVEAKRDDLTRGFTQLAVELIALSMREESPKVLYGAVTIGEVWIFGKLERHSHLITRDIGSYTLPDDLENLVRILVGILE